MILHLTNQKRVPPLAMLSVVIAILVTTHSFLKFFIANYILFEFNTLFEIAILASFCVCLFWSIFKLFQGPWTKKIKYSSILILLLTSALIWFLNARANIPLRLYYRHLSPKMKVLAEAVAKRDVNLINKNGSQNLYIEDAKLYEGGIVNVYIDKSTDLKIFFHIRSGYGTITGYTYSGQDIPLKKGDFGADFAYSKKLENNWYIGYLD